MLFSVELHAFQRKIVTKTAFERSQCKCEKCNLNVIEDEFHFIIDCPFYNDDRERLFQKCNTVCPNFNCMSQEANFLWLLTHEDNIVLSDLGKYIIDNFDVRRGHSS